MAENYLSKDTLKRERISRHQIRCIFLILWGFTISLRLSRMDFVNAFSENKKDQLSNLKCTGRLHQCYTSSYSPKSRQLFYWASLFIIFGGYVTSILVRFSYPGSRSRGLAWGERTEPFFALSRWRPVTKGYRKNDSVLAWIAVAHGHLFSFISLSQTVFSDCINWPE